MKLKNIISENKSIKESVQSLDEKLPNDFATIPNDGNVNGALKHLQHHVDVISKNIKAGKGVYKKDLMKMANIIKSLQKFEGVNEGSFSEIDIMAKAARNFNEFVKEFYKDFRDFPKDKDTLKWLKSLYDGRSALESVNEANIDVDVYRKKQAFVIGPKFAEVASDKDVELMARLKIANSEHAWQLKQNISSMDHLYKKYKIRSKKGVEESIVNEETYKVAGRPVTLIKGKKSNGTDWKVKFQNGKETSLSDVIALIKPFPKDIKESVNEENPCWKGYEQIGMKMKDGKEVPNCVPKNESIKLTNILKEWRAEEVLQQLGGRKFIAMTGAKNFVKNDKDKSITFKIPKAKSGITHINIQLTSSDLYNVRFISIRGVDMKIVKMINGVYNDQLQSIFTQYTGLNTSL
jgi:hypothetical protein